MDDDPKTIMEEEYFNNLPDRSVLGISKDGRVIYTPYYSGGTEYDGCDLDICNGMQIDGHYAYVSTFTHPYIMGCFGPGTVINLEQSCSSNPRTCDDTSTDTDTDTTTDTDTDTTTDTDTDTTTDSDTTSDDSTTETVSDESTTESSNDDAAKYLMLKMVLMLSTVVLSVSI